MISTIIQLKIEYDYFKSYLIKLSKYDTKKCNENCNFTQNSKYLLLYCHHFKNERVNLINNMKSQNITFKIFFETKKQIENLINFLINIEIVTRKWILKDFEDNETKETQNECTNMTKESQNLRQSVFRESFESINTKQSESTSKNEYKAKRNYLILDNVIIFKSNTLND